MPPAVAAVERLTRLLIEAERRRASLLAGLAAEDLEIADLVRERDAVLGAFDALRSELLGGGDALAQAILEDAEAGS